MFELLTRHRLTADVYKIEAFRLRSSANDYVNLYTNLPDGTVSKQLVLSCFVPRGTADSWARANFPGVEFHLFDSSNGWSASSEAASEHTLPDVTDQYDPTRTTAANAV